MHAKECRIKNQKVHGASRKNDTLGLDLRFQVS